MLTYAPFGLRPVQDQAAQVRPTRYPYGILSGYASNIYKNSPVLLATATVNGVAANFVRIGAATGSFLGSFDGVEYTDSNGRPAYSAYWPASLAPSTTTNQPWYVYIWDDPRTIFEIQASGAVMTQTTSGAPFYGLNGQHINTINTTTGSAVTQLSAAGADPANIVSSGSVNQLRIVGLAPYVDNAWTDPYPILRVQIASNYFTSSPNAI